MLPTTHTIHLTLDFLWKIMGSSHPPSRANWQPCVVARPPCGLSWRIEQGAAFTSDCYTQHGAYHTIYCEDKILII